MTSDYLAFLKPIEAFQDSIRRGQPDFVGLQKGVSAIAAASGDNRLQTAASHIVDLTKSGVELQTKIPGATAAIQTLNKSVTGDPFASYGDGLGRIIDMIPGLREVERFQERQSQIDRAYGNAVAGYRQQQSSNDVSPAQANAAIAEARRLRDEAKSMVEAERAAFRTPDQRALEAYELEAQAITARTTAQRAALASDRARGEALQDSTRLHMADADAQRASSLVYAEAAKEASDYAASRAETARQRIASAELEVRSIGLTATETERLRQVMELTNDARQRAFQLTGDYNAVSAGTVEAIKQEAAALAALGQQAKDARLSQELLFEAQQAGRSRDEQQIYSRLQSAGLLTGGQIVGDEAQRAAAVIRSTQAYAAQAEMVRDLTFETQQLGRSESERSVYARMASAGLLDHYGRISGATNQAIADQIRLNETVEKTQAAYRGFGREALDALAKGDVKGVLAKFSERTSSMLMDQAGGQIDDFISGSINSLMGGSLLGGLAGKPDGSTGKPFSVTVIGGMPGLAGLTSGAGGLSSLFSTFGIPQAANSNLEAAARAIKAIESSGGNYGALGPVTGSGDRAYGAYQVMGNNIPSWTQQHLGRTLTPAQFLANPSAQDSVFNGQFGGYMNKYGPVGASRAWFAGEGGMNRTGGTDVLGTSVGGYGDRFGQLYGQYSTQLQASGQQVAAFGSSIGETTPTIGSLNTAFQNVGDQVGNSSTGILGAASSLNGASQQAAQQATTFTGGLGGAFEQIVGGIVQIGSGFVGGFGSVLQSILGGIGGAGGGKGGLLGGMLIPGILHEGGTYGSARYDRAYPAAAWAEAPRYHSGFGSSEFPAVLEKTERVLTGMQDQRATAALGRSAQIMSAQRSAAAQPASTSITINAPVTVGAGATVTKADVDAIVARRNAELLKNIHRDSRFQAAVTSVNRTNATRRTA